MFLLIVFYAKKNKFKNSRFVDIMNMIIQSADQNTADAVYHAERRQR